MNYIREINSFYDWLETNTLTYSAISLWHALMHIANKAGWPEEFAVAISTLESKTGLKKDAIIRARNRLRQVGRINFRSRTGRQSAIYQVISFEISVAKNDTIASFKKTQQDSVVLNDANRDTNRAQTATQTASINKLNKTKLNNINNINNEQEIPVATAGNAGVPDAPKKRKISNRPMKVKYAEFVSMTNDEYSSLVARLGSEERARRCIEIIDNYKGANGKKYKSDYRAILNWVITRLEEEEQKKQKVVNIHADSSANTGKQRSKYKLPDDFYWSD